jgi:uncharacterized protein (TIGR03435 family)
MFDLHLELTDDDLFNSGEPGQPVDHLPAIATAMQKLGFKLESAKAPAPFVAIEHVELPTEN